MIIRIKVNMSLARGLMHIGRLNIYNTLSSIDSVNLTNPNIGDTLLFNISVHNINLHPIPTGNIYLKNNGEIVASDALSVGLVTLYYKISGGKNNFTASYPGIINQFKPSQSDVFVILVNKAR